MRAIIVKLAAAGVIAVATVAGLAACEEEGPAEQVGESVDEAAEEAGEALEESGEKLEDTTD